VTLGGPLLMLGGPLVTLGGPLVTLGGPVVTLGLLQLFGNQRLLDSIRMHTKSVFIKEKKSF
jgi:hypothetical protein